MGRSTRSRTRDGRKPNETHLIDIVITRKVWLALDEFSKDTTHTPDVDGLGILMACQHDFRGSVPASDNIFCEEHGSSLALGVCGIDPSSKSEIANLQVTIRVHQQIRWFQITMDDFRRVNVLETAEDLVDEVLRVINRELLFRVNDSMQIGFH